VLPFGHKKDTANLQVIYNMPGKELYVVNGIPGRYQLFCTGLVLWIYVFYIRTEGKKAAGELKKVKKKPRLDFKELTYWKSKVQHS
jgi:hypothetical protein